MLGHKPTLRYDSNQTSAFYAPPGLASTRLEKKSPVITINVFVNDPAHMAVKHLDEQVLESDKVVSSQPPLYRVLLLNDDYTPMEFVVHVLQRFFGMDRERATVTMLKVHNEGVGLAGVYPRDIAESKVYQVLNFARSHQHPLQCVMEENR